MYSKTTSSFSYDALPLPVGSKSSRVLQVHDGNDHETIQAELFVIDLGKSPIFDALSYVHHFEYSYLPPEPNQDILVNGITVKVMKQCHSALIHLRRKLGAFTIWIDALSINQEDDVEKASQVALMGDIYSSARNTYIWLGEGSPAKNRAMSYMGNAGLVNHFTVDGHADGPPLQKPRVLSACFSAYLNRWTNQGVVFPVKQLPQAHDTRTDNTTGTRWTAYSDLEDLLDAKWIRRIWTLEELMFSRSPIVICGDNAVPWSQFAFSIVFLFWAQQKEEFYGLGLATNRLVKLLLEWRRLVRYKASFRFVESLESSDRSEKYEDFVFQTMRCYWKTRDYLLLGITSILSMFMGVSVCIAGDNLFFRKDGWVWPWVVGTIVALFLTGFFNEIKSRLDHRQSKLDAMHLGLWKDRVPPGAESIIEKSLVAEMNELHAYNNNDISFGVYGIMKRMLDEKCKDPSFVGLEILDKIEQAQKYTGDEQDSQSIRRHRYSLTLSGKHVVMKPDYSINTIEAFHSLALLILLTSNSLDFLIACSLGRNATRSCPSWIPSWPTSYPPVISRGWFLDRKGVPEMIRSIFDSAAGLWDVPWRIGSKDEFDVRILRVQGIEISTVQNIQLPNRVDLRKYNPEEDSKQIENLKFLLNFIPSSMFEREVQTPELDFIQDWLEVISLIDWRPWNYYLDRLTELSGEPKLSTGNHGIFQRFVGRLSPRKEKRGPSQIFDLMKPMVGAPRRNMMDEWEKLLDMQQSVCHGMARSKQAFFETEDCVQELADDFNSRDIGICSEVAQPGDKIVLIHGVKVPMIIRQVEDGFQIVCPAVYLIKEVGPWMKRLKQNEKPVVKEFTLV